MMPPTKRAEAEAVVPGLADCLAIWRYEGDTFTEIAWRLRTDYGITWNQVVDRGSLLGDEVELEIAVEAVRN